VLRGIFLSIAACGALALALVGCGGGDETTTDAAAQQAPAAEGAADGAGEGAEAGKPRVKVPKGKPPKQLEISEIKVGDGAVAKPGDEVTVQYVGVNYKSGEEFDASWDRGEPFTFTLGAGEVIQGWDQGVQGMKVGGRRRLTIPPSLGYGPSGAPPAIPPNETLVFVVDLLEVN